MALPLELELLCESHDTPARLSWRPSMTGWSPGGRASQRQFDLQHQPKATRLSLLSLSSLPHRIAHPPRAEGKVRSFGITPHYRISLEDLISGKHLPPIGLKDFEEWLLFVEHCPENLYFVLWLREYTARYNAWVQDCKASSTRGHAPALITFNPTFRRSSSSLDSRGPDNPPPSPTTDLDSPPGDVPRTKYSHYRTPIQARLSPELAEFFGRAKETFFSPPSPYFLDLSSDVFSPIRECMALYGQDSTSPSAAHPDPAIFSSLLREIETKLDGSLKRFVLAAYYNVGNRRTLCGLAGALFFIILGTVAPISVNFTQIENRWIRLTAIPGLWLGLFILIASLHGVCMMIWVFGDLRQLRTFELYRPARSKKAKVRAIQPITRLPQPLPLRAPVPSRAPSSFVSQVPPALELAIPPEAHTEPLQARRGIHVPPIRTDRPRASSLKPAHLSEGQTASLAASDAAKTDLQQPRRVRIQSPPHSPLSPETLAPLTPLTSTGVPLHKRSLSSMSRSSTACSTVSVSSSAPSISSEYDTNPAMHIEISGPFYDRSPQLTTDGNGTTVPKEGRYSPVPVPFTSSFVPPHEADADLSDDPSSSRKKSSVPQSPAAAIAQQWRTAGFIRPWDYSSEDDSEYEFVGRNPRTLSHETFDFDALPPRHVLCRCEAFASSSMVGDRCGCSPGEHVIEEKPRSIKPSVPWTEGTSLSSGNYAQRNTADPEKGLGAQAPPTAPSTARSWWRRGLLWKKGLYQDATSSDHPLPLSESLVQLSGRPRLLDSRSRPGTADSRPRTADSRPRTADSRPRTADSRPRTADSRPRTADSRPRTADSQWSRAISHCPSCPHSQPQDAAEIEKNHKELFLSVPAFKAPLTRVLSPVIVRAQWEITIRSAAVAALLCVAIGAGLVAIP